MENASKAMIMIGFALIALILMSLLVSYFRIFGGFSRDMHSQIEENQQHYYNSQFYKYDRRIDITTQEIASCINLAASINYNMNANPDDPRFIHIKIDGKDYTEQIRTESKTKGHLKAMNDVVYTLLDNHLLKGENKHSGDEYMDYYRCNANARIDNKEIIITYPQQQDFNIDDLGYINEVNFHKLSPAVLQKYNGATKDDYRLVYED